MGRLPVVVLVLLLGGCAAPRGGRAVSFGLPHAGYLHRGVALPDRGPGYVRGRPGEDTRFGLPHLVAALERAAASVREAFPGSPPLRIGDLSAPLGGQHDRHHSHRAGRDADLAFFVADARGRPLGEHGTVAFDRFGVGREDGRPEVVFFDVARNWQVVRTLVLDDEARVQWIFCSHGVKTRLLRYASRHETDPDALFRATRVLHQPTSGRPHSDHFHVRVLCGGEQRALGCVDHGPRWSWLRDGDERLATPSDSLGDPVLVGALLDD